MRVLIVNVLMDTVILLKVNHIPKEGDAIDRFYTPCPKIMSIIHYPSKETLEKFKTDTLKKHLEEFHIDAIIFCK